MLITISLADISLGDREQWLSSLHRVAQELALVSALGSAWVLLLHLLAKPGVTYSRRYICLMAISVLWFSISIQTCRAELNEGSATARLIVIWAGQ